MTDPVTRLLSRVTVDGAGCWLWEGSLDTSGYGLIRVGRRLHKTHRYLYEAVVGPIPDGLQADHLCRVRHCCNPEHIDPKTPRANSLAPGSAATAAINAAKTHCPKGHPYDDQNTYPILWSGKWRGRACKVCRNARQRAWRASRAA